MKCRNPNCKALTLTNAIQVQNGTVLCEIEEAVCCERYGARNKESGSDLPWWPRPESSRCDAMQRSCKRKRERSEAWRRVCAAPPAHGPGRPGPAGPCDGWEGGWGASILGLRRGRGTRLSRVLASNRWVFVKGCLENRHLLGLT
jgi:hypothetical protein